MSLAKKYSLRLVAAIFTAAAGLYLLPVSAFAQLLPTSSGSSSDIFGDYTNLGGDFLSGFAGNSCKSECSNSTCQLTLNSQGILSEKCPSGRRYDVDPYCIMNQNVLSGSCLDTIPVTSINRVSETNCYRANGAGPNPKPRNHLGTDYAAVEGTAVTAAADGQVVWAKEMGGGGRVIIIEHEKKCQCTSGSQNSGCDNKYITVYMHLKGYAVNGGSVKRGDVIGWVGGSNYSSGTGTLCDWPNKKNGCSPYGPHLHFEIHSGGWEKGYPTLKTSIINPLCDDIQTFCGGCSYDVQQCQGKTSTNEWTTPSDEVTKIKKYQEAEASQTQQVSGAQSGSQSSEETECELEQFLPTDDECWFCPMFRVLFNTASTIALNSYKTLAAGIANVVIVCFALWVSLLVLRHVASVEVKDPRKMIQEFLGQAFRVLVVILILKVNFFQIVSLTLEPVFNTGMTFVQTITGKGTYNSSNPDQQSSCSTSAEYMKNIMGYDSSGFTAEASGGLPLSMGQNIVCSIKSIQDSIGKMMAYGRQAICVSWRDKAFIKFVIPSFPFLITGIVIYLGGLMLLIAFPWCLVDAVLQMSIASGLAPAAIGAWAFKITSGYLKKIWDFFMNAMFNFVFLSIIIYIIMTVVDQFMRALNDYAKNTSAYDFLIDPINGLAYWGITGMKLVVVCLMGWVFLDEGKSFSNHFAKGADMDDIGRHVGGAFAQGAQRLGKSAGKIGKKVGKTVGGAGAQVADHFIGSKIRKGINNFRINRTKNKGTAIRDNNGNIIGYERTRRSLWTGGKKVTSRVSIGADGKEVWSRESQSYADDIHNAAVDWTNQQRLEKLQNDGTEIRDKNGKVIGYTRTKRPWYRLGQKVTLTAMKQADGSFAFQKDIYSRRMEILAALSPDGSAINKFARQNMIKKSKKLDGSLPGVKVSSDHLMSIREKRDSRGNVYQRDIAFNTKTVKHLVYNDGTLNTNMINQIAQGSRFDQNTVMEAVAMEVLKTRGIKINNQFKDRQITFDQNGIMHIIQRNYDGSVAELNIAIGGKNKNQMLTEVKVTQSDGSYSVRVDNGIMKKVIKRKKGQNEASVSYSFNDEYYRRYKYFKPLNELGDFAPGMDVDEAMFGFNEHDKNLHAEQVYSGKSQIVDAHYTSVFGQANENTSS